MTLRELLTERGFVNELSVAEGPEKGPFSTSSSKKIIPRREKK